MGITAVVGDVVAGSAAADVGAAVVGDALVGGAADAAAGAALDVGAGAALDAGAGAALDAGAGAALDAGVASAGLSSADAAALYGAAGYGEAGALTASQTAAATAAGWTPGQIAQALATGGQALGALTNVVGNIGKGSAAAKAGSLNAAAATASGQILANAANVASQQQQSGIQKAIDVSKQTIQQQTNLQQPYINAGSSALSTLSDGLKPGGQYNKAFTMADAQNMDAYKFALDQGRQAITNAAAAGGQSLSTADQQSQAKFAEGTAAQYEQQAFNQWLQQNNLSLSALQQMVSTGQLSTNQLSNALTNAGVSQETLNQNLGNAQASGTVGAANAQAGAIVGANNANAAGTVAAANANGNALTAAGNAITSGIGLYNSFNNPSVMTPTNSATIQTPVAPTAGTNVETMIAPPPNVQFSMDGSNLSTASSAAPPSNGRVSIGGNLNTNYSL